MDTLPRDLGGEERRTRLICPDCGGVLTVRKEGHHGFLHFRCRVGHAYALDSVIAGKERRLEEYLWTAVMALEELADLLADARAMGDRYAARWGDAEARIARLRADAQTLREVVLRNEPIDLGLAPADDEVG